MNSTLAFTNEGAFEMDSGRSSAVECLRKEAAKLSNSRIQFGDRRRHCCGQKRGDPMRREPAANTVQCVIGAGHNVVSIAAMNVRVNKSGNYRECRGVNPLRSH